MTVPWPDVKPRNRPIANQLPNEIGTFDRRRSCHFAKTKSPGPREYEFRNKVVGEFLFRCDFERQKTGTRKSQAQRRQFSSHFVFQSRLGAGLAGYKNEGRGIG